MPYDAGTILAKLKLDRKHFEAGVKSAKKGVKGLTADIKGMASATNVLLGGALIYGTKKLIDFTDKGARLKDMERAFENMAEAAGTSTGAVVASIRAITKTLSRGEIMRFGNMLEMLGVGIERLPRLTEIARAAAIGLGQSTSYMLESIATGTARQSRLWLDNLGIIVSIDEANRSYAESLGKTVGELTDVEKRAAFVNAVLSKGQGIINKVGVSTDSAAEKTGSLTTAFKELGDAGAKLLANKAGVGVISTIAGELSKLADALNDLGAYKDILVVIKDIVLYGGKRGTGPRFGDKGPLGYPYGGTKQPVGNVLYGDNMIPPGPRSPLAGVPGGLPGVSTRPTQHARNFHGLAGPSQMNVPDLMGDKLEQTASIMRDTLSTLGDSFGDFFADIVTGAKDAGVGFAANMMFGLSSLASSLGDMYIQAGIGLEALKFLSGPLAIAAGLALKAVGGFMRGAASNIVRSPQSLVDAAARIQASPQETSGKGKTEIHVHGDFIGDRYFITKLAEMLRKAMREGEAEVVFT
jgi:hypothetical protein